MSNLEFDPETAIGEGLLHKDRQELCQLVSRLCLQVKTEVGSRSYRGGIFPENIGVSESGQLAIGPAKLEKWSGQELEFIAPELYWDGKTSPAADVYSLGMLLYYGLGNGKLPFETESASGQLARMSGKALPAPKTAGKRLGEIMEKATAFQAADRYQTPEELQIMLESCLDNKYLGGASGAETVFRKQDGELSDMERLMVDIMESGEESVQESPVEEHREEATPAAEDLSPEEIAGLEKPEPKPVERESVSAMVEEFFGSQDDGKKTPEAPPAEEPEDVRVYEPSHDKKERGDRKPIPILTEEKNPELAPVVLKQQPRYSRNMTDPVQQEKAAQEVKMRRSKRPLTVVLGLCALLIVGALIANIILKHSEATRTVPDLPDLDAFYNEESGAVYLPDEPEVQFPVEEEQPTPEPEQPRYTVTVSDMSWTEAQDACRAQGGHLAVISTREEFDQITALAQEQGITRLWIGCHRENDSLVWETDEPVNFTNWADNEPSYWDYWDNVAEDYVMIYQENGAWYYNDNRNDPAADYPEFYRGTMGYVCEFEN